MAPQSKQYYIQNNTGNDLILSDLGIKIPAWTDRINVFQLKPSLTQENIRVSESNGSLKICLDNKKINKLGDKAALQVNYDNQIRESVKAIPSRAKTSVVIKMQDTDYIEKLTGSFTDKDISNFENIAEGFSDPMEDKMSKNAVEDEEVVIEQLPAEPILDDRYGEIKLLKNHIGK